MFQYNGNRKPRQWPGFNFISTNYAFFAQAVVVLEQLLGLQPGLQSGLHPGLQVCSVHCFAFLAFLGLLLFAKAPVANEHTSASINIFFMILIL